MPTGTCALICALWGLAFFASTVAVQAGVTHKELTSKAPLAGHSLTVNSAKRASPRFEAGYRAACNYATFGGPRDSFAYHNEPAYRAGWKAGYAACLDRSYMGNAGKKVTYN
ncbi:MAG: hypothetical protein KGO02_18905 [Alphaproteobacteria bacterium]|nr:hypothetical protein [Alphaproteobacteria bacterium]